MQYHISSIFLFCIHYKIKGRKGFFTDHGSGNIFICFSKVNYHANVVVIMTKMCVKLTRADICLMKCHAKELSIWIDC